MFPEKNEISFLKSCCLFFAIYCLFVFTGCASETDLGRMQWDLNEVRADVKKLKESTQAAARTDKSGSRIKDLETAQKATSQTVSDLVVQIQTLTTEFQALTGRLEEMRFFSEKSSSELMEGRQTLTTQLRGMQLSIEDLKMKVAQLEAIPIPVKIEKAEIPQEIKKEVEKEEETPGPEASTETVENLYISAYQTFKEGNTAGAIDKFTYLLKNYPESDYADNARFWIGEAYYNEEKYEDAILAYQELFDKNPQSDKIPGAMLKQGLAFYALRDQKTGQIMLEKLIEKYPDSEQAKVAMNKIGKPVVPPKKK